MANLFEGFRKVRNGIVRQNFRAKMQDGILGGSILNEDSATPLLEMVLAKNATAYSIQMTFAEYNEWKQNADAAIAAHQRDDKETVQ